jgi:hypothetical protein
MVLGYKDLTEPERAVWDAIETGTLVDLRAGSPERDDPANGESWGTERLVRSQLLYELLTNPTAPKDAHLRGLRLAGARITGLLVMEAARLACPLRLEDCRVDEPANFARTSCDGSVSFDGSIFAAEVSFRGARFRQRVSLNGALFYGNVNFGSAIFESDATVENATFRGAVVFEGTVFRRMVSLRASEFQSDLLLDGAEFNQNVDVTNAIVAGKPLVLGVSPVGNRWGAGNDRVAREDQLNFSNYVKAFVDLIRSADTRPPLTIGIFGSWGMGKSFLLEHIERSIHELQDEPQLDEDPRQQRRHWRKARRRQKRLDRQAKREARRALEAGRTSSKPSTPRVHVVHFNAWEYSATEIIWPGLVRKVMDRLEIEISWGFPGRFLYRLWRNILRQVRENQGRLFAAAAIAAGLISFGLWRFQGNKAVLGGAAAVAIVVALAKVVVDGLSSPLSKWVTTLFQERDYGRQIGYWADIREDLEFLERRLHASSGRILVTIDDLDRCEPEKTVEVLQAINLLLNFESFIVCLGIDARVVTRAVEDHYKGVLVAAGASGYEYLDKVVQIPFRIPEPTDEEVRGFLSTQMGNPQPPGDPRTEPTPPQTDANGQRGEDALSEVSTVSPTVEQDRPSESIDEPIDFTWIELDAFRELVPFLRPNPRHLKRLVNVYRLVRTLALAKGQTFIHDNPAITVRWLAMCAQWPYTSYALLHYFDGLLEDEKRYTQAMEDENAADNPLAYLYKQVTPSLSKDRQRRLDDEVSLFEGLLDGWFGQVTWKQLEALRQYTVNFNPAIEGELEPLPPKDTAARPETRAADTANASAPPPGPSVGDSPSMVGDGREAQVSLQAKADAVVPPMWWSGFRHATTFGFRLKVERASDSKSRAHLDLVRLRAARPA